MSYNNSWEIANAFLSSTAEDDEPELQIMKQGEQDRAHDFYLLPKEMYPSKESFEASGFTFQEEDDDVLLKTTLPEGWTIRARDDDWSDFFDQKGRMRGTCYYKDAVCSRFGHMVLATRYRISHNYALPNDYSSPIVITVRDSEGAVLFFAGKYQKDDRELYTRLKKVAEDWLNTQYPGWEDPSKYWD